MGTVSTKPLNIPSAEFPFPPLPSAASTSTKDSNGSSSSIGSGSSTQPPQAYPPGIAPSYHQSIESEYIKYTCRAFARWLLTADRNQDDCTTLLKQHSLLTGSRALPSVWLWYDYSMLNAHHCPPRSYLDHYLSPARPPKHRFAYLGTSKWSSMTQSTPNGPPPPRTTGYGGYWGNGVSEGYHESDTLGYSAPAATSTPVSSLPPSEIEDSDDDDPVVISSRSVYDYVDHSRSRKWPSFVSLLHVAVSLCHEPAVRSLIDLIGRHHIIHEHRDHGIRLGHQIAMKQWSPTKVLQHISVKAGSSSMLPLPPSSTVTIAKRCAITHLLLSSGYCLRQSHAEGKEAARTYEPPTEGYMTGTYLSLGHGAPPEELPIKLLIAIGTAADQPLLYALLPSPDTPIFTSLPSTLPPTTTTLSLTSISPSASSPSSTNDTKIGHKGVAVSTTPIHIDNLYNIDELQAFLDGTRYSWCVAPLVAAGCNPTTTLLHHHNASLLSQYQGHLNPFVQELIKCGAALPSTYSMAILGPQPLTQTDHDLISRCRNKHYRDWTEFQTLVTNASTLSFVDDAGMSPLHLALSNWQSEEGNQIIARLFR
jgi:hypothetical protein